MKKGTTFMKHVLLLHVFCYGCLVSRGKKKSNSYFLSFRQCRITDPIDRKAGALMEYLLEGIVPFKVLHTFYPNEKNNTYKSSLMSYLTKSLTEGFLLENVPL